MQPTVRTGQTAVNRRVGIDGGYWHLRHGLVKTTFQLVHLPQTFCYSLTHSRLFSRHKLGMLLINTTFTWAYSF
jgi:hypothetical protein